MKSCSETHDTVWYETRFCPACKKVQELEIEIEDLQNKLDEAKPDNEKE